MTGCRSFKLTGSFVEFLQVEANRRLMTAHL
jgi:hypothetical protein